MDKKEIAIEGFTEMIECFDEVIEEILFCLDDIKNINSGEEQRPYLKNNEKLYFNLVADYSGLVNRILDVYFENDRDEQIKYKPDILYYRQLHEYLIFLIRFPEILRIADHEHDEIAQTRYFLENKKLLIEEIYNKMAEQQHKLFNGTFRKKLNNLLAHHQKKKIQRIRDKNKQ
jgi:hypothetical protein